MSDTRRLGKYRLVRRLAVGGSAEVYLAVAEGLSGFEKQVVLKRLLPEFAGSPEMLAMFLDEARLMALLHHPHIAEVYDIGEQEGQYFFTLEKIDGCDLRDLIDLCRGQPLPLAAALTVVLAVADALEHAHRQRGSDGELLGVVHRDVTPSNILCGRQGEVKLVDFGVAKWAAQRARTEQGTIKGKFSYMSPEQCRAEPLDRRSDVFALGVVLYELTTGQRPFVGESEFELLSSIVEGRTQPPSRRRPDYPPALEATVCKALSKDRELRFPSAAKLRDALAENARELGLSLGPATVAELVHAREAAAPTTPPSARLDLNAGRTATDLAATTTPWAPAATKRPRRWWPAALAVLLAAVAAGAAWQGRARVSAAPAASEHPAAEKPRPEQAVQRTIPAETAEQLARREDPETPKPQAVVTGTPATTSAPPRPSNRAATSRRQSRPRPARAEKPSESVHVWDPDSPTPP